MICSLNYDLLKKGDKIVQTHIWITSHLQIHMITVLTPLLLKNCLLDDIRSRFGLHLSIDFTLSLNMYRRTLCMNAHVEPLMHFI